MKRADIITAAQGVPLDTELYGSLSDVPLILLHGAGNNMMSWDEGLVRLLVESGYCVVRMDSRDAGRSFSSPHGEVSYSLRDMAEDVLAVCDFYDFNQVSLAGVSQGAAVAQLFAIAHPERLSSLVLISATPGGSGHDCSDLPSMTETIKNVFEGEQNAEPDWTDSEATVSYLIDAERPFAGNSFNEELLRRVANNTFDHADNLKSQMMNPFMVDPGAPWRAQLGEIQAPTVIIHGTEDPLFPIEHGEALAAEISNATLLKLEGVGHANIPTILWPQVVASMVRIKSSN